VAWPEIHKRATCKHDSVIANVTVITQSLHDFYILPPTPRMLVLNDILSMPESHSAVKLRKFDATVIVRAANTCKYYY
jgi:hypothetical protein